MHNFVSIAFVFFFILIIHPFGNNLDVCKIWKCNEMNAPIFCMVLQVAILMVFIKIECTQSWQVHDGATLLDEPFKTKGHTMDFLFSIEVSTTQGLLWSTSPTLMCQKFHFEGEFAIVVGWKSTTWLVLVAWRKATPSFAFYIKCPDVFNYSACNATSPQHPIAPCKL